jgi:hypothetical protein
VRDNPEEGGGGDRKEEALGPKPRTRKRSRASSSEGERNVRYQEATEGMEAMVLGDNEGAHGDGEGLLQGSGGAIMPHLQGHRAISKASTSRTLPTHMDVDSTSAR